MNWHRSDQFAPLMLLMGGREKYRLVSSLREVAETLIAAWPSDDGEEYMAAVKICLEAIHGKLSAQDAREALIRAADEAGIPVIRVVH
ncbi:DUF982 domain-containing protein [Rhizobium cauense]|uniref:DUF982 domain-containing protein n=1 Tax=Rhizobium cauense TaxID=1166683 RepID=UPI001C6EC4CB|nr:DUF982 domain-containing protein [Rhizobium cauense]MBW9113512.1 DUF982 domain-containing protein [Rhizobium cauense]